ncbi:MAG: hypothetical protein AAF368_01840, partial [Planctomycetota bacterium]
MLSWSAAVLVFLGSASTWDAAGPAHAAVSNRYGSTSELEQCFARARTQEQEASALGKKLHALGLKNFPELFELGALGSMGSLELESEAEHRAVFEALCAFPPSTLGSQLERVTTSLETEAGRLYGLDVLTQSGTASEVDDAFRIAAWAGLDSEPNVEERIISRGVRVALAGFLRVSFDREEDLTRTKVLDGFSSVPLALTSTLVDTLAEQYGRRNFLALADLVLRRSELDPYLLVVLSREAGGLALPVPERVLSRVRACLDSAKTEEVRALSIRLLGRLEDEESLPVFLGELVSESSLLSDAALDALRACTGRKYGRNPRSWRSWIRSEERWWAERSQEVLVQVCDGRGGSITQAIQAVAHRRLRRHELAQHLEC